MKFFALAFLSLISTAIAGGGGDVVSDNTVTPIEINLNMLYNSEWGTYYLTNSYQKDVITMKADIYPNLKDTDPLTNVTIVLYDTESDIKWDKSFDLFDANGKRTREDIKVQPLISGKARNQKVYQLADFQATSIASYGLSRQGFARMDAMYKFTNLNKLKGGYTYTIEWKVAH